MKLEPFDGEQITVGPSDTGVFSQSWTLSISDGLTCPGSFIAAAIIVINGQTLDSGEIFYLPTGVATRVTTWSAITSAALLPQVAPMVHLPYV